MSHEQRPGPLAVVVTLATACAIANIATVVSLPQPASRPDTDIYKKMMAILRVNSFVNNNAPADSEKKKRKKVRKEMYFSYTIYEGKFSDMQSWLMCYCSDSAFCFYL